MDTPRSLGFWNTLHAVDTALILELAVGPGPFYESVDLFKPTSSRETFVEDFNVPTLAFGEALVHSENLGREKCGFFPPCARTYFKHDIAFVIWVLRQQKLHQLPLQALLLFL